MGVELSKVRQVLGQDDADILIIVQRGLLVHDDAVPGLQHGARPADSPLAGAAAHMDAGGPVWIIINMQASAPHEDAHAAHGVYFGAVNPHRTILRVINAAGEAAGCAAPADQGGVSYGNIGADFPLLLAAGDHRGVRAAEHAAVNLYPGAVLLALQHLDRAAPRVHKAAVDPGGGLHPAAPFLPGAEHNALALRVDRAPVKGEGASGLYGDGVPLGLDTAGLVVHNDAVIPNLRDAVHGAVQHSEIPQHMNGGVGGGAERMSLEIQHQIAVFGDFQGFRAQVNIPQQLDFGAPRANARGDQLLQGLQVARPGVWEPGGVRVEHKAVRPCGGTAAAGCPISLRTAEIDVLQLIGARKYIPSPNPVNGLEIQGS